MALLDVEQLSVYFVNNGDELCAVDHISYQIYQDQVLGIVGESGSGKSVSSLAIMGLIDHPGRVLADKIKFNQLDLHCLSKKKYRRLLGSEIAMIFQDPMNSLNPVFTVGFQLIEVLKSHYNGNNRTYKKIAIDLLAKVGISDGASRLDMYPHQLSGGMSQRIMIAMAIACKPKLLIADEPTTSLDVTIQSQIIELLLELHSQEHMALIFITHDLALLAETVEYVIILYAGQVVESGNIIEIFKTPRHPYTQALLRALPEFSVNKRLISLPGTMPSHYDRPIGCILNPRCPYVTNRCRYEEPKLHSIEDRQFKCHYPLDDSGIPTYEH